MSASMLSGTAHAGWLHFGSAKTQDEIDCKMEVFGQSTRRLIAIAVGEKPSQVGMAIFLASGKSDYIVAET